MKYLKTYELKIFGREIVWEYNPEIGDYVVFSHYAPKSENFCKITSVPSSTNSTYYGEIVNGKNVIFFKDDIIRKMKPEEIEQFKIERDANKYNL